MFWLFFSIVFYRHLDLIEKMPFWLLALLVEKKITFACFASNAVWKTHPRKVVKKKMCWYCSASNILFLAFLWLHFFCFFCIWLLRLFMTNLTTVVVCVYMCACVWRLLMDCRVDSNRQLVHGCDCGHRVCGCTMCVDLAQTLYLITYTVLLLWWRQTLDTAVFLEHRNTHCSLPLTQTSTL